MAQGQREGEHGLARRYQDPVSWFDAMFDRMQRDLFGASLLSGLMPVRGGGEMRVPHVEMHERDDAIEITAELPGIEPDNVKLECEDNVLTIRGESRAQQEREGERSERYASFFRRMSLPDGVDADQAQASYRNGVLSIRFPHRAQRRTAREIPIGQAQEEPPAKGKGKAA